MKIPRYTYGSPTPDETKIFSLLDFIRANWKSDQQALEDLSEDERTIRYLEMLSGQINIQGFANFFSYAVGFYYYLEVLQALRVIGADSLADILKESKELLFGDGEIYEYPEDPHEDELKALEDRAYKEGIFDDFHMKWMAFTLRYFEENGFSLDD